MTYAGLALLVLAGCASVTAAATAAQARRGAGAARLLVVVGVTAVVLVALTVVFDSAMVAADLFAYDEGALLGPRVLLTPVEDLAWPLAAALLLPSLLALADGPRTAP